MLHSGELPEQLLARIFNFEITDFQQAFGALDDHQQSSLRRMVFQVMVEQNMNVENPTDEEIQKIQAISSVYDFWRRGLGVQTELRSSSASC